MTSTAAVPEADAPRPPGRAWMPRSIRARLLLSLLATTALIWMAAAGLAYRDALHEVDELLDAHLAQAATLLVAQGGELGEIDTEHAPLLHKYSRGVAFQVWENGRKLLLHSTNAPNTRLSRRDKGFADERIDGRRWRVYSVWSDELLIQVAEEDRARAAIAHGVSRNLILPLLVGLPLLGALIAWSVRRHLRPLSVLSAEVGRRAPDHLAPLPLPDDLPAELVPLLMRLNTLLAQLSASFDAERRFTADAAHELRTPLAALKVQAQVAQRAATEAERSEALAKVLQAGDRAARLIDQLLTLARLEPAHLRHHADVVDLRALAASVTADLAPQALQRGIELAVDGGNARIDGHADLLAILLRNLVDNAIRYSPDHTRVRIGLRRSGHHVTLEVVDQGPGIAAELRDRLGQRFQRLGRADASGTGLGLSIAQRIAQLHGTQLQFADGDDGRGLRVHIRFEDSHHTPA